MIARRPMWLRPTVVDVEAHLRANACGDVARLCDRLAGVEAELPSAGYHRLAVLCERLSAALDALPND